LGTTEAGKLDALAVTQPIASRHWMVSLAIMNQYINLTKPQVS